MPASLSRPRKVSQQYKLIQFLAEYGATAGFNNEIFIHLVIVLHNCEHFLASQRYVHI